MVQGAHRCVRVAMHSKLCLITRREDGQLDMLILQPVISTKKLLKRIQILVY